MKRVVITTDSDRRGVFGGELSSQYGNVVTLRNARMCLFWSASTRGVLGLASAGPDEDCRISRAVPEATFDGVTAVLTMTDEAWERWESEPWG